MTDSEKKKDSMAATAGNIGGGVAAGLDSVKDLLPEDAESVEGDVRVGLETAADVVKAASEAAKAVDAAERLTEAIKSGEAGSIIGQAGNLLGGSLGMAGALLDVPADLVSKEQREGLKTGVTAVNAAAGVARAAGPVAEGVQNVARIFEGTDAGGSAPRDHEASVGRGSVADERGPLELSFESGAELGDIELVVESGAGRETLSGLYTYTMRVEVRGDGGLADEVIDELLRAPACVRVGAHAAQVHGLLTRVEMFSVSDAGDVAYELELAPRLSRLALTHRSRVVAQDQSQLDAVKIVLDEHRVPYEDCCEETYPVEEQIIQYQETDLTFVLRLLERNGIHFFFQQDDSNEVLVLGDSNRTFESVPEQETLRYDPTEGRPGDGVQRVTSLRRVRQPRTAEVVLRDYDWRAPTQVLRATADADERSGAGRWDLYGEHWREASEGQRLARVRAEEQLMSRDVYFGETTFRALRPGMWFELEEHPLPELNQRYLVIRTSETLVAAEADYRKNFEAIPFDVVFRPQRAAPWPRIEGLVNALVDGEAHSIATPIDEEGRYRLVLPLDEAGVPGGRATRWVRRAQPSAGPGYGMHFPLHIGTEVAVGHVNGDPDRPVIVGAVPNAATPSPVTAGNATQGFIRTAAGMVIELENDAG